MGPYMSQPIKTKSTYEGAYNNLVWAACGMQGWRNSMEDAHIHATNIDGKGTSVFGIFDGHGGKEVAMFVEKHFIEELKKYPEFQSQNFDIALEKAFYKMDEMLETEAGKKEIQSLKNDGDSNRGNEESYAGCTANIILISNGKIWCANAGDSRTVLGLQNDIAFPMSEDHKPDDNMEKQRIQDAGGFVTEGRVNGNLNLSRAMGDLEYKNQKARGREKQLIVASPDIKSRPLDSNTKFILMGCDGIWECLTNEQLIKFCSERIQKNQSPKQIVENLLDHILAPDTQNGYGCDNMSTILIVLK